MQLSDTDLIRLRADLIAVGYLVDDVLDRRTRIGLVSGDRDLAAEAAAEMIAEFGEVE